MNRSRRVVFVAVLLATAVCWFLVFRSRARIEATTPLSGEQTQQPVSTRAPEAATQPVKPSPAVAKAPEPIVPIYEHLPKPGIHSRSKVWVRARYGSAENQLLRWGDAEGRPPQGFVPTRDGKLLVLDSWKMRLVWYDAEGTLERTMPLPKEDIVMPAGVAITDDGTIAIMDSPGVQTKGTLLLDPSGKKKGELPQVGATFGDMYAAGNSIYAVNMRTSSVKVGDTDGTPTDETPGVFRNEENAMVPGFIAPDGKTVVSVSPYQYPDGFIVNSVRGDKPEMVFAAIYKFPYAGSERAGGIEYVQSDVRGRLYIVLWVDQKLSLLCLDGQTGAPVGLVPIPGRPDRGGTQFTTYNVVPSGGIVFQRATPEGSSYEWFNCHPD